MRLLIPLLFVFVLAACVQENNPTNVRLADVTVGQQLIDLKVALAEEALTEAEYEKAKAELLATASYCAKPAEDSSGWNWF